jgi:histidine triad (HIT) family protein
LSAARPKREQGAPAPNCIFCRIAAGQAPAWVVYEDAHAIAFLDTRPIAPGHILVCPKAHSERLTEMEEMANLTAALKKVAQMVEENLAADYNLGANQGALAGQVVFHHHWHVIPRYEGERQDFWTRMELTDEMAKEILGKLGVKQERRG